MPIIFILFIAVFCFVAPVKASPLPGDVCAIAGVVVYTGGADTGGAGNMMICKDNIWTAFLSYNGSGQITRIGDQSCGDGQVLSYNGLRWGCADKAQLECGTQVGPNCPAGYVKTGYTPDLALGLGSFPVCCRVQ